VPAEIVLPMKTSDFDYVLPESQIAQTPATPRDSSRLMVIDRSRGSWQHAKFNQLGDYLRPGDVLVLNATRVFPARLRGRKSTGGKIEFLLLRQEQGSRWQALVRGPAAIGTVFHFAEGLTAKLEARLHNGEGVVVFSQDDIRLYLEQHGEMPLPPYIERTSKQSADTQRYQTVYARSEGSIAAPTAGFHFTADLMDRLRANGVKIIEVVLHVGWGTFRPIRSDLVQDHSMLPETYSVEKADAEALTEARAAGGRVVAVGTTAVRTLETIFDPVDGYRPGRGETSLYIYPGYRFRAIDAFITNFHLPHSTPLLLACAFYSSGRAEGFSLRNVYEEAISQGYRFYSYGDAMLIQ
jgi:S-adenosylmethionine:tRNA ribosyltransferase-isomerase